MLYFRLLFTTINYRAPRGIDAALDLVSLNYNLLRLLTVTDELKSFWNVQERVSKLNNKKPVLTCLAELLPWEAFAH